MNDKKKLANGATQVNEMESGQPAPKRGGMGKIFLMAGIVLVQAAVAYTIVNGYYPEIIDFANQFESVGGVYYQIENVIVNPAESKGERYLILSLTIELNDGGSLNTLNARSAELQDRINTTVSNFTAEELSSLEYRNTIKKQLGIVINEVIGKKAVRNLFFTKYVLQ